MIVGELFNILKQKNIPDDAVLMSDSGWECCATDTDGVYYNKLKNTVVLTQEFSDYAYYHESNDWIECRNATNGDMIKAVFPNINFYDESQVPDVVDGEVFIGINWGEINGANISAYKDWWNAPYKPMQTIDEGVEE